MKLTRRDVLRFAGGGLIGTLFTPIPWKLLDDTAIWTQNWAWLPKLPRGPISTRFSHCTLCPAGCTLRARCCNGVPVGLTGVPNLATKNGVLCAAGFASHHMPYHPLRLNGPRAYTGKDDGSMLIPVTMDATVEALGRKLRAAASATSGGSVAILDQRPGRALSRAYQEFLSGFQGGQYLVSPSSEDGTLRALRNLSTTQCPPLGYDFENARTVLSFGAPLLDGWGVPEQMYRLFSDRSASGRKLIQIESSKSRTARAAASWLPVAPGTEAVLALGLANVIVREGLYSKDAERRIKDFPRYRDLVLRYHPHPVAALAGVDPDVLVDTARAIASSPSIVVSGADPAAGPADQTTEILVAGLNLLVGNVGRKGGIVYRRDVPGTDGPGYAETALHQVPDHSIGALIMDGMESGATFPHSLLKRKLVEDGGTVVLLSPYLSGHSAVADYLVPTASPWETWEEVPAPPGATSASFSLAVPLLPGREYSVDAYTFLKSLSKASGVNLEDHGSGESLLRRRAEMIAASKRGMVYAADGSEGKPASSFANGEAIWQSCADGGTWVDDAADASSKPEFSILGQLTDADLARSARMQQAAGSLTLVPFSTRAALSGATISPVMSKVFQESDLRMNGGTVLLNPKTALLFGLKNEDRASVRTKNGLLIARVLCDPTVKPGLLHAAVGPLPNGTPVADEEQSAGVLSLCTIQDDGSWRFTEATIEKV